MGHMNVRLYVEKQVEGLAAFTHALDMPLAFQESAPSTLVPVDQHVRFIREVLPGRPISMDGCIVSVGESDAVIYQELRHSDGALSAAFLTRVAHVDTKARERFAWSTRARAALEAHIDTPPAEAAPRSFDPNAPALATTDINIATARNLGIPMIGKGAVPQHHLDVHGCMSPAWIIGRISDSVPNLLYDWRKRGGAGKQAALPSLAEGRRPLRDPHLARLNGREDPFAGALGHGPRNRPAMGHQPGRGDHAGPRCAQGHRDAPSYAGRP